MKLTLLTLSLLSTVLSLPATPSEVSFPITDLLNTDLSPEEYLRTLTPTVEKRQFTGNTYNQLTDGTPCRPITLIYARGTGQQGNVGDPAAVGPLFFNNLAGLVGGVSQLAIQGVTYSANVLGFLAGGDSAGSTTMTNLINTVSGKKYCI